MKTPLASGVLLLAVLVFAGCASGPSSSPSTGGARCLSRPDTSGTQPLIYLFCVQTN